MVLNPPWGDVEWDAGPQVDVGGTKQLSEVNTGRVLMADLDRVMQRGDDGRLAPKHGAWRPGMHVFSSVTGSDYASQPRGFVAVGDVVVAAVNSIYPSLAYTPSAFLNAVCNAYGSDANRSFVAVGDGGLIVRSDEWAANWGPVTSGTTKKLRGVGAYDDGSNGVVVAVGDDGTLLRSDYGATWAAIATGVGNHLRAVAAQVERRLG